MNKFHDKYRTFLMENRDVVSRDTNKDVNGALYCYNTYYI